MSGDAETGVCIMQMEAGLDTGPVLISEKLSIEAEETTGMLHDRLSGLGAQLIVKALSSLSTLSAASQPNEGVTYAEKIDKSEARIDWTAPAEKVDRLIRGLSPFPGAWCEYQGERIKLLGCRLGQGSGEPGTVLDGFEIACGSGSIIVTKAQRAGKRAMNAGEVLAGLNLTGKLS